MRAITARFRAARRHSDRAAVSVRRADMSATATPQACKWRPNLVRASQRTKSAVHAGVSRHKSVFVCHQCVHATRTSPQGTQSPPLHNGGTRVLAEGVATLRLVVPCFDDPVRHGGVWGELLLLLPWECERRHVHQLEALLAHGNEEACATLLHCFGAPLGHVCHKAAPVPHCRVVAHFVASVHSVQPLLPRIAQQAPSVVLRAHSCLAPVLLPGTNKLPPGTHTSKPAHTAPMALCKAHPCPCNMTVVPGIATHSNGEQTAAAMRAIARFSVVRLVGWLYLRCTQRRHLRSTSFRCRSSATRQARCSSRADRVTPAQCRTASTRCWLALYNGTPKRAV